MTQNEMLDLARKTGGAPSESRSRRAHRLLAMLGMLMLAASVSGPAAAERVKDLSLIHI